MSLATPPDRNDYGVVFYGVLNLTPGTYTDVNGNSQDQVALVDGGTTEVFMDPAAITAYFHVGEAQRYSLQVEVIISGTVTVDLFLHGELNSTTINTSSPILSTYRNDTVTTAASQSYTATLKSMLQTANLSASFTGAIGVKCTTAGPEPTARVIVYLRVAD